MDKNKQTVFIITKIIAIFLILLAIFFFLTTLALLPNYNAMKAYGGAEAINYLIVANLIAFVFLILSGIGLFRLRILAVRIFSWVAIWFILFYLGIFTLLLRFLGGSRISYLREVFYIIIGVMGIYLYKNMEYFKNGKKI